MAAIIFDFDGTLADTFDFIVDFLAEEAGRPLPTPAERQQYRGLSMQAIGRRLGHSWPRLFWLFLKGRRKMHPAMSHVLPYAGMPEVVRKLHNEGHELFMLSSNRAHNIRTFLRNHDLYSCFLQVYGNVGLFGKAPALRRLLRDQQIDLKDAIYIGDEMRDVQAAESIGMKVIGVLWGFARPESLAELKPTALVRTPEDLLAVLEEI